MKSIRAGLALAALTLALTSCAGGGAAPAGTPGAGGGTGTGSGGGSTAGSAQPGSPAPQDASPSGEQAAVEAAFRDYGKALLARDYASACAFNTPEATATLIKTLAGEGVTVGTCEEAFDTVYAIPGAAETADRVTTTMQIQSVQVTGDTATVHWSAQGENGLQSVDSPLRRDDGKWRLLATSP